MQLSDSVNLSGAAGDAQVQKHLRLPQQRQPLPDDRRHRDEERLHLWNLTGESPSSHFDLAKYFREKKPVRIIL